MALATRVRLVLATLSLLVVSTPALDNGLGKTPPMGFNTWNHFGYALSLPPRAKRRCNNSEKTVKEAASALVALGLKNLGYNLVALDDCWQAPERDEAGQLAADPAAFPSGMAALGTYLHERGLLYGIYSSAGFKTCAGRAASLRHEVQDATLFASWGVDFLKYDNCFTDGSKPEVRYPVMRDALNATGRPIFYALCEWGVDRPASWASEVGNSWRTTIDIDDTWLSVLLNLELTAPLWESAGPGGWNDPDMLEVGNGGLLLSEERAHFALWAALKAPLILGCDLTRATPSTLLTVSNPEVIAVNQDALGAQAARVWSSAPGAAAAPAFRHVPYAAIVGGALWREEPMSLAGARALCALGGPRCTGFTLASASPDPDARVPVQFFTGGVARPIASSPAHTYVKRDATADANWREVWAGPLSDGALVVVMFNRDNVTQPVTARWADIGLCSEQRASVRDLWQRKSVGVLTGGYTASVRAHDVVMLRVTPVTPLLACSAPPSADATAAAAAARDVPDGVWGLAWQHVVRRWDALG